MVKGARARAATLGRVRGAVVLGLLAVLLAAAACGPTSPTQAGGDEADPVALLTVLPSPGQLRGEPAAAAGPERLQQALTGAADPAVAERVRERAPRAAGVRSWSGPGGQQLVAVVSVWDSHLIATGVGADAAEQLLEEEGASAWTPADAPGSRGARVGGDGRRALRLAFAVGPNSVYVRSEGPVLDDVVVRTMRRLVLALEGAED
jgi:hypothetical protein